jgi:hypothetical protein
MLKEEGKEEEMQIIEPEAPLMLEGEKEEFAPPREEDTEILMDFALEGEEKTANHLPKPAEKIPVPAETGGTIKIEGTDTLSEEELEAREAKVIEELEREAPDAASHIDEIESETFEALEELEALAVQALENTRVDEVSSIPHAHKESPKDAHAPLPAASAAPASYKADLDEFDLDLESLELDLKKIVVKETSKPTGEVKKVVVEDMDGLDLDFEEIDSALKGTAKKKDDLDPDDLVIDFDRIKNDS